MTDRFMLPGVGPPAHVRFPGIAKAALDNGLRCGPSSSPAVPVVSVTLVVDTGTASDPADRPGSTGLVADLLDEGAGSRNAIELSDALARIGSHLEIDTAPDATTLSLTTLARFLPRAMDLLADIMTRPHLSVPDLDRVRELRVNRLRQMRRMPGAAGDRALLAALFGSHPYGHGAFGTTRSLEAITADEARAFWSNSFGPARTTLVDRRRRHDRGGARRRAGGVRPLVRRRTGARDSAAAVGARRRPGASGEPAGVTPVRLARRPCGPAAAHAGLPPARDHERDSGRAVHEPDQSQASRGDGCDLRRAHVIRLPARPAAALPATPASMPARRRRPSSKSWPSAGPFDRPGSVGADELGRAKASLTRGYVKHFETAGQLARAAAQIVSFDLDEDEYDRFVPRIDAVTEADIASTAQAFLHPDDSAIVVVGDAARCQKELASLDRPVDLYEPEF